MSQEEEEDQKKESNSSQSISESSEDISPLPLIMYASSNKRLELFAKKLKFCCETFDFSNPSADIRKKEIKRIYLNECIDFLKDRKGHFIEPIYALTFALYGHNVFRVMPTKTKLYDPDRNNHVQDPAWCHLQLVYIFFIKFLDANNFHANNAKPFIDKNFVAKTIDMFATDDDNERDHLKIILHRLYAKFISLRTFMRKEIGHKFLELAYNDLYYPGITELLEVLGSIIQGFSTPLKKDHIQFLQKIMLPLHFLPKIHHYHSQLIFCITQYFDKDEDVIEIFLKKFIKHWPRTKISKELLYLDELEELIDGVPPHIFINVQEVIFSQLARCIKSCSYQVSERALSFWENEYAVSIFEANREKLFPIIIPSLVEAGKYHWCPTVQKLATNVVENFINEDGRTFNKIVLTLTRKKEKKHLKDMLRERLWQRIEAKADQSNSN